MFEERFRSFACSIHSVGFVKVLKRPKVKMKQNSKHEDEESQRCNNKTQ